MAKKDLWMPLNIGDYLADTMSLTAEQHGVYLLLLMDYWKSGPLTDDDAQLAATGKVSLKDWTSRISVVIRRFFTVELDGLLHQKRADLEIAKTGRISKVRKKAAQARHEKTSKPDAKDIQTGCKSDANAHANEPQDDHRNGDIARVHALAPPSPSEKKDSDLRSAAAPPDARTILWQQGLPIIRSLIGQSETQARAFLGKMLKASRDDCSRLLRVILEAQSLQPIEPAAWLMKSARPLGERNLLDDGPVEPTAANPTGRRLTEITPW